jgi:hypothetical protein
MAIIRAFVWHAEALHNIALAVVLDINRMHRQ